MEGFFVREKKLGHFKQPAAALPKFLGSVGCLVVSKADTLLPWGCPRVGRGWSSTIWALLL